MTTVHIPHREMLKARRDALVNPRVEVIGFFVWRMGYIGEAQDKPFVDWKPMRNTSPTPSNEANVRAEDIAQMIIHQGEVPLAMFHSHPSGDNSPSQHDLTSFPHYYVDNAFIWSPSRPDHVTHYTPYYQVRGWPLTSIDSVFIQVEA